jgi:CDP-glucose 4,6-dehydratase
MAVTPDRLFWNGKRVLLTGHTGFKGSWLALWLSRMGADITGISLEPNTSPALFDALELKTALDHNVLDIRDTQAVAALVHAVRPEIVFHLAAQPLVRASYSFPIETFSTNVMGTVSVLNALRGSDVRVSVIVTTDKVYRNAEDGLPYCEDDMLGGHDPYSASKAACEIVVSSYRDSFLAAKGTAIASARAGNVIGGGDWADERLIPDAVRAWIGGFPLHIRRPDAVRPWQHVLEPLSGYLVLAQRLWTDPTLAAAYNFGPETGDASSVRNVINSAQKHFPHSSVEFDDTARGVHEAQLLSLNIEKSRSVLAWQPRWTLDETIAKTIAWYRRHDEGADARMLCEEDIEAYELKA